MEHLFFVLLLLFASYAFAKFEIQIEGPNGWASNLPTWRLPPSHWVSRVFFGGRPTDGYHVWLFTFIFFLLHAPFLYLPFSIAIELKIVSFFILLLILEDFLWFVINPAFGIKKFKKENIWWHASHWLWIIPAEYLLALVGIGLYFASYAAYIN
ncbi:MAG: hypothetical protein WCV80_04015 [Candidatus Paceibacterota bacterium]|jgi:hypothetical protein